MNNRPTQETIFSSYESDNYFERRNKRNAKLNEKKDFPMRLIELYELIPKKVLEIGAADGERLSLIAKKHNANVYAIEPSTKAISLGKKKFPSVNYVKGVGFDIPLNETFDLIIVNFVLHWVDRSNLLRTVSEIDRLLNENGYLIIGDFLPSNMSKVIYHHIKDQKVYTYKQNYASIFLASGLYHSICLITGDHASDKLVCDVNEKDRIGTWLLKKKLNEHYGKMSY